mmetsp:Transcript_48509/g.105647  ORF Transcript_48509/g.105647 Transcript_48509/m.105647 type:complete len:105 (-) Transcript_48509:266-580(-)
MNHLEFRISCLATHGVQGENDVPYSENIQRNSLHPKSAPVSSSQTRSCSLPTTHRSSSTAIVKITSTHDRHHPFSTGVGFQPVPTFKVTSASVAGFFQRHRFRR